ncbi:hypothetical protein CLU79DRAFT_851003 [Phycomyces nitens]|nr:hypothetical protein CLU79DRAFT_851003 [Phycomyces nitens]
MPAKKKSTRNPPKSFRCDKIEGCNMVFTRSEHLARHIRKHTGDKPYTCNYPLCERHFSRYDNMMQHQQTHYRVKKKPAAKKTTAGKKRATAASKKAQSGTEAQLPQPSTSGSSASPMHPMSQNGYCYPMSQPAFNPMSIRNLVLPSIHRVLRYPDYQFPSHEDPAYSPVQDYSSRILPPPSTLLPTPGSLLRTSWIENSGSFRDSYQLNDRRHSEPEPVSRKMSWQYTPERRSSAYSFETSGLSQLPLGRRLSSSDLAKPITSLSNALIGDACLKGEKEEAPDTDVVVTTLEYQALEGMCRLSVSQPA